MIDKYYYAPKIVLNKYNRHEDGRIIPVEIFGSNSQQGTSIYLTNAKILLDIGVPFDKIAHIQPNVDLICISHAHSDHINWDTLHRITNGRPDLKIILPDFVKIPEKYSNLYNQTVFLKDNESLQFFSRTGVPIDITAIKNKHGTEFSMGYEISIYNSNLLFSTDLSSTSTLPQTKLFDLILIETNYDKDEYTDHILSGAKNHLSVQEAIKYATSHITEMGHIIPLHFGPSMSHYNQLHE